MDFEKLKQWMDIAQKYQVGDFWNNVFDQDTAKNFMNEFASDSQQHKPHNQQQQNAAIEYPPVDIFTVDAQVVIMIEVPGVDKQDIQLTVSGQRMSIKGMLRLPFRPDSTFKNERNYGEFQRTFDLPEPTDGSQIRARYNHGLLVLTYPMKYAAEERVNID
ncbi:Hsp20/alpha crystallin family protein [Bacillus salacetis]|uniref:Hsp20/alpha crystallin family protein n=1 Tax=Bacillus salacetis TaxID=2315464 RepID=A0A3A1R2E9_9BACI|nr:Hsp20/alpha crystallin family protein [Bacillus salacetis]RIW34682.1 Hsp20/alpha crystallin family protein [Bacillus salacetis]